MHPDCVATPRVLARCLRSRRWHPVLQLRQRRVASLARPQAEWALPAQRQRVCGHGVDGEGWHFFEFVPAEAVFVDAVAWDFYRPRVYEGVGVEHDDAPPTRAFDDVPLGVWRSPVAVWASPHQPMVKGGFDRLRSAGRCCLTAAERWSNGCRSRTAIGRWPRCGRRPHVRSGVWAGVWASSRMVVGCAVAMCPKRFPSKRLAFRIQRDDLLIKPRQAALPDRHSGQFEVAVAITRHVHTHVADFGSHRLRVATVATVTRSAAINRVRFIAEMPATTSRDQHAPADAPSLR